MAWETLVNDDATTYDTIELMLKYIRRYSGQKEVSEIIKKLPQPNSAKFLPSLFEFVAKNISYKLDPDGTEIVHAPSRLMKERIGDCKKMTGLIASVLKESGVPVFLKVVAYEKSKWSHIYPVVPLKDGSFIVMDVVNNKRFNKEVKHNDSMFFNLNGKKMNLVGMGSLSGVQTLKKTTAVGRAFAEMDADLMAISSGEAIGQPKGFDEDVEDSEIEIYSIAGMGFFREGQPHIGRRKSKAERKAKRRAKKTAKKAAKATKKVARKARRTDRKEKRQFIKSLPRSERPAVRKALRQDRQDKRKFARKVKKLGKSKGLPGPISKFIGKHPELFLAYFLKNNNPEVELTTQGAAKWNRVAKAVNKLKTKKGVDPAELLAFVDTVIEQKYGMPAEEYAMVYILKTAKEKGFMTRAPQPKEGMGEVATAVVVGAIAAASAIITAVLGLSKKDLNESDLPAEDDVFVAGDEETGAKPSKKRSGKLKNWLKNNLGDLLGVASSAADTFIKTHGNDPDPDEIDAAADETVTEEDKKGKTNLTPILIGGGVIAAFLLLRN